MYSSILIMLEVMFDYFDVHHWARILLSLCWTWREKYWKELKVQKWKVFIEYIDDKTISILKNSLFFKFMKLETWSLREELIEWI